MLRNDQLKRVLTVTKVKGTNVVLKDGWTKRRKLTLSPTAQAIIGVPKVGDNYCWRQRPMIQTKPCLKMEVQGTTGNLYTLNDPTKIVGTISLTDRPDVSDGGSLFFFKCNNCPSDPEFCGDV